MTVEEIQQLKDLLQDFICDKINSLERLMNEKFDAAKEAKELDAKEVARRLEFLNGEAERLRDMQATYVPREVQCKTDESFRKDIDDLKSYRDKQIGKSLALSAVTGGVVALIVGLLLKLLTG